MEKIIIYTNENCPYCKKIKEELTKKEIKFENRLTEDFPKEWKDISFLTGLPTVPTIEYKNTYFVPSRDFGNPNGLINLLENFEESNFSDSKQALEKVKTLNYNIIMAFNRLDRILKQIETKLNTEENEHKSTS